MNNIEKNEIEQLPDKYRPMGAWSYLGYNILYSIPVIGFIFLVVFALSDSNISRRSHARSYFCGLLISLIFIGIFVGIVISLGAGAELLEKLQSLISGIK